MVRSVDQLVEEWKGTDPGLPQGIGKDWGQLGRVPSKGRKSYHLKQEGEWWQRSQSPERFEDQYDELDSAFTERTRDILRVLGEIKVDQLRDNRSRHQFGERVVTILSWNRAAKKRTGHICTIPRIGTQA